MPDLLLANIEYGGYISLVKIIIFLILFFPCLLLISWVCEDARKVGTKEAFWAGIVFIAAAAGAIIWLIMPFFILGMLLYLIAVGAASVSYLMHRDAKVSDFDRVLSIEHVKGMFVNRKKQLDSFKKLLFITANGNDVPVPSPKTPDFFGYKAAYDIFTDATWRRASDIVFVPTHQNYNVTYYVDGAALKQPDITREEAEFLIRFMKNVGDLDTNEKRKPQKGRFKIKNDEDYADWQVSTAGSTAGEQFKFKHITQENIAKLSDINLMPDQYEQLDKICKAKQGVFIVAGQKKTGVTTTFYALLRNHDPFISNVTTLENKPSAELVNITQNVYSLSDTGTTTYAKKLQALVRMDPDVIGVADCEDSETAKTACEAAKEGKTIYVTLEAENVLSAAVKWMKLVGDRNLAAETLLGISNQRLLRKLCTECKQAYEPNKELLKKFNISPEKAKILYRPAEVQQAKRGKPVICNSCQGTGFVGRTGIFEIIIMNDDLRNAIKESASLSEIGTQFRRAKMLYLQEQAMKKVVDGTTAINEMVRILSTSKKEKAEKSE